MYEQVCLETDWQANKPEGKHISTLDQIQDRGSATSITCDKNDKYLVCNKEDVTECCVELLKGGFRFRYRDSEGKGKEKPEKGLGGLTKGKKEKCICPAAKKHNEEALH